MVQAAFMAVLLASQDAGRAEAIETRVRRAIDESFRFVADAAVRAECARTVAAPLLACKNRERVDEILDHLPKAAEFHATGVSFHLDRTHERRDLVAPPELVKEAAALHAEYLAARIARVAKREWTQERVDWIRKQIDSVFGTAREVLAEKLKGDAAEEVIHREVDGLRDAWKGSLLLPFNVCLDTPLAEEELKQVQQGLRDRAKDFAPLTPTAADLEEDRRSGKIGAARLIGEVRESCYKAAQICFSEFKPFDERDRAWRKKLEAARDKALDPDK